MNEAEKLIFGHYEVLQNNGRHWLLGKGAMGSAYKAMDTRLHKVAVVKIIHPTLLQDSTIRQRFFREARAMARLEHPHIARIYYLGEDLECPFYAMEFCEGPTLQQYLKEKGKLAPEEALRYLEQLASALEAVESAGLVHRDIKPSNIVLTPLKNGGFSSRLLDFGVVRYVDNADAELTLTGVVGTMSFASPEQLKAEGDVDIRADFYALGSTLWCMLAGKPPFSGTIYEMNYHHMHTAPPLQELSFLPAPLLGLLRDLLAKNKVDRPANSAALLERIRAITAAQKPGRTPVETELKPLAPLRKKSSPRLALAVVLILTALFAGGGFAWWKMDQSERTRLAQERLEASRREEAQKKEAEQKAAPKLAEAGIPNVPKTPEIPEIPVVTTPDDPTVVLKTRPGESGGPLQKRINAAKAGETVEIPAGIHAEPLRMKTGIHLTGEPGKEVILRIDAVLDSCLQIEDCPGGSVENLIFEHAGDEVTVEQGRPVVVVKSSSIQFKNCQIRRGQGDGLLLTGSGSSSLGKLIIKENRGHGLTIERAATPRVEGCEIWANGGSGVEVRMLGSLVTLTGDNRFYQNSGCGLVAKDSGAAEITGGNFDDNSDAGLAADGEGAHLTASQAQCSRNKVGISVQNQAAATLSGCETRASREVGIYLNLAGKSRVEKSIAEANAYEGMQIVGNAQSEIHVLENQCRSNGPSGITIAGRDFQPVMEGNIAEKNAGYGLMICEGAKGSQEKNHLANNRQGDFILVK